MESGDPQDNLIGADVCEHFVLLTEWRFLSDLNRLAVAQGSRSRLRR
jgi:hypothetical protein